MAKNRIRITRGIGILVGKVLDYIPDEPYESGDVIVCTQKNSVNYGATNIANKNTHFLDYYNWKKVDLATFKPTPNKGCKRMINKIIKYYQTDKSCNLALLNEDITFSTVDINDNGSYAIFTWKVLSIDNDDVNAELVSSSKGTTDAYMDFEYADLPTETIEGINYALEQYEIGLEKFKSNQHYANL